MKTYKIFYNQSFMGSMGFIQRCSIFEARSMLEAQKHFNSSVEGFISDIVEVMNEST